MNFNKVWDMLSKSTLYFARLDSFEDPIEGLPLEYRGRIQTRRIIKYSTTNEQFAKIPEVVIPSQIQIDNWQKRALCSCWYLTETNLMQYEADPHHESLAMWNYLDGDEGFLFKINFRELHDLVSKSIMDISEINLFDARYGKVYYFNYGEYDRFLNSVDKVFMPALIKHNSYKFENELRFIILSSNEYQSSTKGNGLILQLNIPFNYKQHQIELFSHPNMKESQFKKYQQKFREIGVELKLSTIISRKIVNDILNNA